MVNNAADYRGAVHVRQECLCQRNTTTNSFSKYYPVSISMTPKLRTLLLFSVLIENGEVRPSQLLWKLDWQYHSDIVAMVRFIAHNDRREMLDCIL